MNFDHILYYINAQTANLGLLLTSLKKYLLKRLEMDRNIISALTAVHSLHDDSNTTFVYHSEYKLI